MQESTRLRATPRLVIFSWVLIGLVFGIAMTTAWQAFALGIALASATIGLWLWLGPQP